MDATMASTSSESPHSDPEGLNVSSSDYEDGAASLGLSTVRRGRTATTKGVSAVGDSAGARHRTASANVRTPAVETASTTLRRVSGDYSSRMEEAQSRSAAMERYKMMVQAARLVPTPAKAAAAAADAAHPEANEGAEEPAYPVSTEVSEDSSDDEASDASSLVEVSAIQERRGPGADGAVTAHEQATVADHSAVGSDHRSQTAPRLSDRRAAEAALSALCARPSSAAAPKTVTAQNEEAAPAGSHAVGPTAASGPTSPAVRIHKRRPSQVAPEWSEVAALTEAVAAASNSTQPSKPQSVTAAAVAAVAAKRAATARALAELETARQTAAHVPAPTKASGDEDAKRAAAVTATQTHLSPLPTDPPRTEAANPPDDEEAAVVTLPDGPVLPQSHLVTGAGTRLDPDYNPIYARGRPSHNPRPSTTAPVVADEEATDAHRPSADTTRERPSTALSSSDLRSARRAPGSARRTDVAEAKRPAHAVSTGGSGTAFWVRPSSALYEMTASIAAKRADAPHSSPSGGHTAESGGVSARSRASRHHATPNGGGQLAEEVAISQRAPRASAPLSGRHSARRASSRLSDPSVARAGDGGEAHTRLAAPTAVTEADTEEGTVRRTHHRHGPRPSARRTTGGSTGVAAMDVTDATVADTAANLPSPSKKMVRTNSSSVSSSRPSQAQEHHNTEQGSSASKGVRKSRPSSRPSASATGDSAEAVERRKSSQNGAKSRGSASSRTSSSHTSSVFTRLSSTNNAGLCSAAVVVPVSARSSTHSGSATSTRKSASQLSARQQESFQRHCSRLTSLRTAQEEAEKATAAKDQKLRTSKGTRKSITRTQASTATDGVAAVADAQTPPRPSAAYALRLSGTISKQLVFDEEADTAHWPAHTDQASHNADDDDDAEPCPLSKAPRATARRDSGASLLVESTPPKSRRRETDKNASPARAEGVDDDHSGESCVAPPRQADPSHATAAATTSSAEPSVVTSLHTQQRIADIRAQYEAHHRVPSSARASAVLTGLPPMPRPSAAATNPVVGALQSAAYQRRCVLPCYLCGELQSLNAFSVHLGLCHKKTMALMESRGLAAREDLQAVVRTMSQQLVPNSAEDAAQPEREAFAVEAFQCAKQLLVACTKCGSKVRLHDAKEHELLCGRAHYEKSKAAERVRETVQAIEAGASLAEN